jgi:IPT/TIG domain
MVVALFSCFIIIATAMYFISKKPTIKAILEYPPEYGGYKHVQIIGKNFGSYPPDSCVFFGEDKAETSEWQDKVISVTVPVDLDIGEYPVFVITSNRISNFYNYKITNTQHRDPGEKEGYESENEIWGYMENHMGALNMRVLDKQGWTFTVVNVSKSDGDHLWKLDKATRNNAETIYFLLTVQSGEWKVTAAARNPQELKSKAYGAPDDLIP